LPQDADTELAAQELAQAIKLGRAVQAEVQAARYRRATDVVVDHRVKAETILEHVHTLQDEYEAQADGQVCAVSPTRETLDPVFTPGASRSVAAFTVPGTRSEAVTKARQANKIKSDVVVSMDQ
jgi:hypothetical protein